VRGVLAVLLLVTLGGWGGAQVAVTSDLLEVRRVEPGGRATVVVSVANLSDALQSIEVEVADLFEGAGAIQPAGSSPWSVAPFVQVGTRHTFGPRERRQIPIDISVPLATTGTYFGVVVVTPVGEGVVAEGDGLAVREIVRYAIELVIDVPGAARAQIAFHDPNVAQPGADATTFAVVAHNAGDRWAERVRYLFELYDAESGALVARHTVERGRLYPGAGHRHQIEWGDLPAGDYQLLLLADGDGGDAFAIRYGLRLSPVGGERDVPAGP
jgi:hypothetical protein